MYKFEIRASKERKNQTKTLEIPINEIDKNNQIENSVKILKDTIIYEFDDQKMRKQGIENRVGIAMALIGAISLFIIDRIKISEIVLRMYVPFDFFDFLFVLSGVLFYISFIISIVFLLLSISTRKYNTIDNKYFGNDFMEDEKEVTEFFLAICYRDLLLNHQEQNDLLAFQYSIGIIALMSSLIMMAINLNL